MKCFICLLLVCFTVSTYGQGVFSNQTNTALQKVIEDYPNQFRQIKGDKISNDAQATNYRSKVEIPGASNCVVTQNNASKKAVLSWKCELMEADNFDRAKERFKELYGHIKNTIIKIQGQQPFILNGKYESPDNDKESTSVIFELLPSAGEMQKLKVELRVQRRTNKWKITLAVYEKESNDYAQHLETGK